LAVVTAKGQPLILAGDASGFITTVVFTPEGIKFASFSSTSKPKGGIKMNVGIVHMYLKDATTLTSVNEDGVIMNFALI
jgi:hypothetical protein